MKPTWTTRSARLAMVITLALLATLAAGCLPAVPASMRTPVPATTQPAAAASPAAAPPVATTARAIPSPLATPGPPSPTATVAPVVTRVPATASPTAPPATVASTLLSTEPNLKVAFLGDSGYGRDFAGVLNVIKAEGARMVLHDGDFDYVDDPADPRRAHGYFKDLAGRIVDEFDVTATR